MKRYKMITVILALLAGSLGLSGCIGKQAFPLAARAGDTVAIALGGSPSHETIVGNEIMLDDLDVTIKQNGSSYAVTKRYLFRVYPDPTSFASNFPVMGYSSQGGQWNLVLDLPSTGLTANQQAELVVNTAKLKILYPGNDYLDGKLSSIPVYILPGSGTSHNFNNNGFTEMDHLKPLPQLRISFAESAMVAAVDLDIDYDKAVLSDVNYLKVKSDILKPGISLNQRVYSGNGVYSNNGKMRIMLMTNKGATQASVMKCFVVWDPEMMSGPVTPENFTITSMKFYDESGAPVTGINAVKTLMYQ